MTIDRVLFARIMGGFADRIGRALAPETFDMYLDVLSEQLTDVEFVAGARIVFRTHAYLTWPHPQAFIDAAKPRPVPAISAGEAFEQVLAIAANAYTPIAVRETKIAALSPVAERAYRAAGGRRDFENILEEDVKWTRRRFVEAYEGAMSEEASHADAQLALADASKAVQALIANTARALPTVPKAMPRSAPLEAKA